MIDWLEANIPPWVWITFVVHLAVLGTVAYLILLERKVASWVQDRIGPNRVGLGFGIIPWLKDKKMFGLGQPLADGLKFIVKEDYAPKGVDRTLFSVAPVIMIVTVIISIAVIPWGGSKQTTKTVILGELHQVADATAEQRLAMAQAHIPPGAEIPKDANPRFTGEVRVGELRDGVVYETIGAGTREYVVYEITYRWPFQIANLNIGVLFVLATLSLAVYGVVIGGWASNNKYSFLGGLRATANMISYEIPLGLSILCIVLMFGSLDLGVIVDKQAHYWGGVVPAWNVFSQPLAFLLFLVCIHAEANRAPFDTAEAEQELVGGYHTEYSSMRFALFFLAEYAGMITTSAVCVALFFGGWHLPWIEWLWPALAGSTATGEPSVTTSIIACVVRAMVFFGKTLAIVFVFMWVRWSLPRFRFDQIMQLAWRALIPISLALFLVSGVVMYVTRNMPHGHDRISGRVALIFLAANAALAVLVMLISLVIPAAPDTNRRVLVGNSRFRRTPVPGTPVVGAAALNRAAVDSLPVDPLAPQMGRMGT